MPDLTGYFCVAANNRAKERATGYRKLVRHPKLRASIIEGQIKWQVSNGYGKRSRVETAIGRYESIIGRR